MSMTMDRQEKRLTGWHVLAMLIGFFGFIFAVNGAMIYFAVGSFPGTVTDSSYRDSQRFNAEIAAARAQAERGWKVATHTERSADGHAVVRIEARDAAGKPLTGIAFKATLQRPTDRREDRVVALGAVPGREGVFQGLTEGVAAGQWHLVVEGDGPEGRLFLSENRLVLN